jgi:hypothetical protein
MDTGNTQGHLFITDDCKGQMTYINGVASWRAGGDDWAGVLSFDMSEEVS